MPRIPSSTDIQTVSPQRLRAGVPNVVNNVPVDQTGAAMAGLGNTAMQVGEALQQQYERERREQQERDDRMWVAQQTSEFREQATRNFIEQRGNLDETNVAGWGERFNNDLRRDVETRITRASGGSGWQPSPEAVASLRAHADTTRLEMFGRAADAEMTHRKALRASAFDASLNSLQSAVLSDHTQLPSALQEAQDLVALHSSDFSSSELRKMRNIAQQGVLEYAVRGLMLKGDFKVAEDLIEAGGLDAETELQLRTQLKRERESFVARAQGKVAADARGMADMLGKGYFVAGSDQMAAQLAAVGLTDEAQDFAKLYENTQVANEAARMPMAQLMAAQRALTERLAVAGTPGSDESVDSLERLLHVQKAVSNSIAALQKDPYEHAVNLGVLPGVAPLDLSSTDALTVSLRQRHGDRGAVEDNFGLPVPMLQPGEVKAIDGMLNDPSTTPNEMLGILKTLRNVGGAEVSSQFVSSVLSIAMDATEGDSETALAIITGTRLLADAKNRELIPPAVSRIAGLQTVLGDAYASRPDLVSVVQHAADAIYVHKAVQGAFSDTDDAFYNDSLRLAAGATVGANGRVVGGPFAMRGHTMIPPVPGMDRDGMERLLDATTTLDLSTYGNGVPIDTYGKSLTAAHLQRDGLLQTRAHFVYVDKGLYSVVIDGQGAVSADAPEDGNLYLIDLRKLYLNRGAPVQSSAADRLDPVALAKKRREQWRSTGQSSAQSPPTSWEQFANKWRLTAQGGNAP